MMLMRLSYLAAAATLLLATSGCALFGGGDTAPQPTPLTPISAVVTPRVHWQASVDGSPNYGFTPALSGDIVYAAGRDGRVVEIDVNTGREVFTFRVGQQLASGVGAKNSRVFVTTDNGELLAYDENGKALWQARLTSQALEAPQSDGHIVVVKTNDGHVTAFDFASGKQLWVFQHPQPPLTLRTYASLHMVNSEAVLVGMADGKLEVLNPVNGDLFFEGTVATPKGATDLERATDIASAPVYDRGQICAAAYQGRVACFDARSGAPVWTRDLSSSRGLTLDADNVYATADDGTVWAFSRADGRTVWTQPGLKYRNVSGPALLGRYVLVIDGQGVVSVLSNESGGFVGRLALGGKGSLTQPVSLGERVLIQTSDGKIRAITL